MNCFRKPVKTSYFILLKTNRHILENFKTLDMCGRAPAPWVCSYDECAVLCCTIVDCGGLESILHSKVLPGITETVSWTSGMSSASSFSAP